MKPTLPKGTRDFSPLEMAGRNYILDSIRKVYLLFGFQQIETPAMENLSVLEGKYGEEGDRLLFRILNSGPVLDELKKSPAGVRAADITEKGLRYDLTVPFARYVVMHQQDITFPFRRFQVQPVWRADRPQKGRYREFVQCDADVIGSNSLLNESELIQIIDRVFSALNFSVSIRINNRKILAGIAEILGARDKITDITVAMDKLEKIGLEKVNEELAAKGLSSEVIAKLQPIIGLTGSETDKLDALKGILAESSEGKDGIAEAEALFGLAGRHLCGRNRLQLDLTLARGLNYYTGTILEIKPDDVRTSFTGSLCGGGRYDDLTGIFGLPGMSGVGISFGIDRIYDVMDEMKLFDQLNLQPAVTRVLFVNFGGDEEQHAIDLLQQVRAAGIPAEIYPDAAKMKKQMSYADGNRIPFVALAGSEEMKKGTVTVKDMKTGSQEELKLSALIQKLI